MVRAGTADNFLSIRGKRRNTSVRALKAKNLGRFSSDDRALVRVGKGCTRVLIGMDDLSDWDEEELRRGRRRDKNGTFSGRDPIVVPKVVHNEMVKRTLADAQKLLAENLNNAVVVLTEIVADPQIDAKDRLSAIKIVMDRVMGTSPQKVEITGDAKWQIALRGGIKSIKSIDEMTEQEPGDEGNDEDDEFIDATAE